MLALLRKIFNLPKPSVYKGYKVIHYPATAVWAATYRGKYLKRHHLTGIVEAIKLWDNVGLIYAARFTNEADAWALIDLHIEQRGIANVKVYTR